MNFSTNNTLTHSSFPEQINSNDTKETNNELNLFNLTDQFNKKGNSKYGFSQVNDNILPHHELIGIGINPDLSTISKEDKSILNIEQNFIVYDHKLSFQGKVHDNSFETSMKLENPNKVTIIGYENKLKVNEDKCELI